MSTFEWVTVCDGKHCRRHHLPVQVYRKRGTKVPPCPQAEAFDAHRAGEAGESQPAQEGEGNENAID